MSRPTADDIPRLRPETRYRLVGGQAVVIVQDAGEALVLNEVGSRVLELIDGTRAVREIVERIGEEFAAPPHELERDVRGYLAELEAAGVVEAPATGGDDPTR